MAAREPGNGQEIDAALARVNLLRLQGDYEGAKKLGQQVLEQDPGNATARALLGDVASEEGQLEAAERWYVLALESDPGNTIYLKRRDRARVRLQEHQAAEAAKRVGLDGSRPATTFFVLVVTALVVALGYAGFWIGNRIRSQEAPKPPLVVEIDGGEKGKAPLTPEQKPDEPLTEPGNAPAQAPTPTPGPTLGQVEADEAIAAVLRKDDVLGPRFLDALYDPRTKQAYIALKQGAEDTSDDRVRAVLVRLLEILPDIDRVSLRSVTDGKIVRVDDLDRTPPAAPPTSTE